MALVSAVAFLAVALAAILALISSEVGEAAIKSLIIAGAALARGIEVTNRAADESRTPALGVASAPARRILAAKVSIEALAHRAISSSAS
jgi:hypothetical protein